MKFREFKQEVFRGERALFASNNLNIYDSIFDDGESPLKESNNINIYNTLFRWKYPLWYSNNIVIRDCAFFDMARAGIWYTNNISVENTVIEAPKNFRRCNDIKLEKVNFSNAKETLWHCSNIKMKNITANGDYFAMASKNIEISDFVLTGNYSFDGVKNLKINDSKLLSKDAFWNSENVTVYDSFISGEYLGWNARNLKLVNCVIESLQGMCYIDNLIMENCKLINTTLAFEYSNVRADISSKIDSVINPKSGKIIAESIGKLIIEKDRVNPELTTIICRSDV